MMILLILTTFLLGPAIGTEIKIVESHSQVGNGQLGLRLSSASQLKPSRKPGTLCGHPALSQIVGKCYSLEVGGYKYTVCPFHNVTQHEVALKWNSYNGILGLWSHWNYTSDFTTLTTGHYTDGDSCTRDSESVARSVVLTHECGDTHTHLSSVTEPLTCLYNITLTSPLFCHRVFFDVYNALPEVERVEWVVGGGEEERRRELLERLGCFSKGPRFSSLGECLEGYAGLVGQAREGERCKGELGRLREEVHRLREVLIESGLLLRPPS